MDGEGKVCAWKCSFSPLHNYVLGQKCSNIVDSPCLAYPLIQGRGWPRLPKLIRGIFVDGSSSCNRDIECKPLTGEMVDISSSSVRHHIEGTAPPASAATFLDMYFPY